MKNLPKNILNILASQRLCSICLISIAAPLFSEWERHFSYLSLQSSIGRTFSTECRWQQRPTHMAVICPIHGNCKSYRGFVDSKGHLAIHCGKIPLGAQPIIWGFLSFKRQPSRKASLHMTQKCVCQNRWPYHAKKILDNTPPCPPSPLPCANCQPLAGGNGRFCVQSLDGQGVSGCFDSLVIEAGPRGERWVGLAVGWVDPGDAGGDAIFFWNQKKPKEQQELVMLMLFHWIHPWMVARDMYIYIYIWKTSDNVSFYWMLCYHTRSHGRKYQGFLENNRLHIGSIHLTLFKRFPSFSHPQRD